MALTDGNGTDMVMPVSPMYGGGGFGSGSNGWGGDGWWILLLFLLAFNGNGWGNGFGGGNNDLYPWMNQAEITSGGFRDQMLSSNIDSIQSGVNNLSTQLCNCCCDMQQTVNSGFANAETAANARQMANMQQNFALQSQFADCLKKIIEKAKDNLVFTKYTVGSCAA